jgi:hypothetical protein
MEVAWKASPLKTSMVSMKDVPFAESREDGPLGRERVAAELY